MARRAANKPNATDMVLGRLRSMITDGTLSPGEQIRQQDMAEQFGVSRVPLREALSVLADQGLLEHRLHSGYFVTKRSQAEVDQIRRMLALLEDELLSTMSWPDAQTLAGLTQLNDRIRQHAAAHEWRELIVCNREFHFRMFGLSPDALILEEVRRLWHLADPLFAVKLSTPEASARTVIEHDDILAAVALRDRKRLLQVMDAHRASSNPQPARAAAPATRRAAGTRRSSAAA